MGYNRRGEIRMSDDEIDAFLREDRNLKRDPRLTVPAEAGETYDHLRGLVALDVDKARIIDDQVVSWDHRKL